MAKLIPPVIGDETCSPGERELFRRFATEPGTDDWVVLHSLDVARHRTRLAGEIDFVIAVEGLGVLCLEVKAHQRVARDADGMWSLGGDQPSRVGPFKQASDAMHSIRQKFSSDPSLRGVLFWSAVCFTAVPFELPASTEWHSWQVIDSGALSARPLRDLIRSILGRAREHVQLAGSGGWFDPASPTRLQVETIVRGLRPAFEFGMTPKTRRRGRDAELIRFTEAQFNALDRMQTNRRVVFEGPAGTGKTLLAIEEARRASCRNERVMLVCFNQLLGSWLRAETAGTQSLTTGTLHSVMLGVAKVSVPPGAGEEFWRHELPDLALEKLLSADPPYDTLVVDEAQDLLATAYLDVIDALVVGGLTGGRWRLFGDFTRQAIYGSPGGLEDLLGKLSPRPTVYPLDENCRNTPRIASYAQRVCGLDGRYRKVLRPDSGPDPTVSYWKSSAEQEQLLADLLDDLRADGYAGREIVILSMRSRGSAAEMLSGRLPGQLRQYEVSERGGLQYCSVHSFKGLESPVIVLTDITSIESDSDESLLYIASTRPTERLYVLASTAVKQPILERFIRPYVAQEGPP